MPTPDLTSFFTASAGAGAALVGLLFVAVSVSPGRNVGPAAPPERQAVAASAFTALINAFFTSLAALVVSESLASAVLVTSSFSIIATLRSAGDLYRPHLSWQRYARRIGFVVIGLLIYGFQFYDGLDYARDPHAVGDAYAIAYLLLAIYGIGLARAWQLLGAKRRSFFSWFSPLNDLDEATPDASVAPDAEAPSDGRA
jgi:hypothetical protein